MIDQERIRPHLLDTFDGTLKTLADHHHVSIVDDVRERSREAITSIFNDNPLRSSSEFKALDLGKSNEMDLARSIATGLSTLMINNAIYEGRKEVRLGDFYMALIDFHDLHMWPWRE